MSPTRIARKALRCAAYALFLLATIAVLPHGPTRLKTAEYLRNKLDSPTQRLCMVLVLGCPVLTANQVTFWNALRAAGARPPITHYGQIFSEPLPADRVGCFNRRMSAQGQNRKSSMRAYVFRFASESRHHVTHAVCPFRACQKRTWWACRTLSVKTLNVDARQGGIASRGGRDAERVDCVRHSAVRVFPHVHHHRGDRHAYPADPEKRERALLAPLNVLFSCHCR